MPLLTAFARTSMAHYISIKPELYVIMWLLLVMQKNYYVERHKVTLLRVHKHPQ